MDVVQKIKKSRRRAYNEYVMSSSHWKQLKSDRVKLVGSMCEACGLHHYYHGHHLIYRTPLEACTVSDIMLLCEPCHRLAHLLFSHKTMPSEHSVLRDALLNPPSNPKLLNRQNFKLQNRAAKLDRQRSPVYQKVAQLLKSFKRLHVEDYKQGLETLIDELTKLHMRM